mgnify:FL=1
MKKKLATLITSLTLVAVLLFTLCGCSTYGKVQKAFKNDGWTEQTEVSDAQKDAVTAIFGEDAESKLTIHVFTKGVLGVATVVEFKSDKEMTESLKMLTEDPIIGSYVKNFIDNIQDCQIVNGNCVLVSGFVAGGLETFKKSK